MGMEVCWSRTQVRTAKKESFVLSSTRRPLKRTWPTLRLSSSAAPCRMFATVLGKFHPHGDTAVYDSLVRMAQWCGDGGIMGHPWLEIKYQRAFEGWNNQLGEWKLNIIDNSLNGQAPSVAASFHLFSSRGLLIALKLNLPGFLPTIPTNSRAREFGSIDADPAAAMSYSECRLEVSMATNIPPHNLGELVDVLSVLIHNPEATLQELLEYMPGPDFPTGGLIMGNLVILEAYRTGKGRIVVRGKTDVELLDSRTKRSARIIKEIPHQTNKSAHVLKIAELVENKSLEGISDSRDESDCSGMRVVIELRQGSDP
ncbi:hypothetical protein Pyn_01393 [Prunus yedoensis var. nudiflora]|uniref:Topo IIA-type catalytic domain-containing protein n=1 Tax=Prunus yedoensis var. nudiflora TaxID=2094558 RepID=A0A314Z1B3_PRUYE|nr:hypothetical protein Pyn_01393 [Prunus yedoensis var. nudiflora]